MKAIQLSVVLLYCSAEVITTEASDPFPLDRLSPYSEGLHGSGKSRREISQCQHVAWNNRTYEEYHLNILMPESTDLRYQFHRFADTVQSKHEALYTSVHRTRYMLGSLAYVEDPYYTLSVMEPYKPGGCQLKYSSAVRSTVRATTGLRKFGCKLATNAGYFSTVTGQCLGNIVSDGRLVQSSVELNANFGIRADGTIVTGYIPQEEVVNGLYRQLISGVIWLVRNGTNYVNESMQLECASHQETGKMATFVNVLSARTAIGHDQKGRVVIVSVSCDSRFKS